MRVLIAADKPHTRMALRTMLRDMGHRVLAAAVDGREAFRLACERNPDLAILDVDLAQMDGLTVAEAIVRHCPLPVVIVTDPSERDRAERAAAADIIQASVSKPVRELQLATAVDLALARFAEQDRMTEDLQGALDANRIDSPSHP